MKQLNELTKEQQEEIKKLVIERLKRLPPNVSFSIG
ncbi:MAG: hypothetical protein UU72_C0053G0002 [candidate division WWE3 bacterium GW2011_GWB1_41_6]|uniref:Uncharacterized protein n=1 Tax=candidate division WWE3 bacterium GW2011_GWB1_41_6 TaxID=1619112 RepID=A0A0G0ZMG9_UNCKA|nr:MAG: hypothetical protein UU72_C0053G0002 [candidate division WWE3 bacterium GW2011_GWB1_41_6]